MAEKELEKTKISITKYIKVIWKRRWLVIITAGLTGLAALIISFLVRPMYKSSTTIVLITEQMGIFSSPAVMNLMSMANLGEPTTTDTELEIMTSKAVTTQVIKKLSLQVDRYHIPRDSNGRQLISEITVEETAKPNLYYIEFTDDNGDYQLVDTNDNYFGSGTAGEDFRAAGLAFLVFPYNWEKGRRIEFAVSSIDSSAKELKENVISIKEQANYMLEITAIADDGLKAKRIAEEVINQYVNVTNSFKKSVAHETRLLLEDRMFEIKRKRDMSEQLLVDYQQSHNTVFLGPRAEALANQIGSLQSERIQAEIQSEAIRRSLQLSSRNPSQMNIYLPSVPSGTDTGSTANTDPVITELETQVDQLRLRLNSYLARYTEKHPLVVETQEALRKAENELYGRIRQRLDSYLNTYQAQLSAIYSEFDNLVATMPPEQMEMAHIARDVEEYSAILSALQAQYEEALIQETQEQSQSRRVRIVSPSTVPDTPSFPRKKMNAIYGALAGIILGVVFAFIVEFTSLVDAMSRTRLGRWWQNRFSRRRPR
jgi:uncharacterized protein involved in exopolysaccharide biosynthesis